jgi:hypothetical protein
MDIYRSIAQALLALCVPYLLEGRTVHIYASSLTPKVMRLHPISLFNISTLSNECNVAWEGICFSSHQSD